MDRLLGRAASTLPAPLWRAIGGAVELAGEEGWPTYLVGGAVRDLLLGRPVREADLVVVGSALRLARRLVERTGGHALAHPSFRTAMVRTPDFTLDLVTARRESYPRPGALPSVEPAGIDEDLHRRDFSINALALRLDGAERGALVDPTGGLADLQRRRIRVIHPRSFQDDATRMLRAVRYEARLGFSIDPDTRRLLERDRPFLEAISPARLRHEMARMVAEGEGASALARTAELGLLAAIHPALSWPGSPEATGLLARSATEERLPLALAILAWDASPAQAGSIARRLAATRVESRVLRALGGLRRLLASASLAGARPSQVARALESFPTLALRAAAALEPPGPSRTAILSYLVVWSQVKTPLSGDDLLKLGVAPGPELGRLLGRLRSAALDGLVADRSDALAWVERALAPHGGRKAR